MASRNRAVGADSIRHIVTLMMENRSFDHMLGALMQDDPRINGLTGNESNPDTTNALIKVQPLAAYQGQLNPDPDNHFSGVNLQLYFGTNGPPHVPEMQGFIQSYFEQRRDVNHSHKIMYYFTPERLPVLTALVRSYAVFNGWFSSIPGSDLCNRAFAHYGTSFGQVGRNISYSDGPYLSIYERMLENGRTAKVYYYDEQSSSLEVANLLRKRPRLFGTFEDFLSDCRSGRLPEYCYVEPNYSDHEGVGGTEELASDQHPDHHVLAGEVFIASVYNAIRGNPDLWNSTALLITYDEHGGLYDHVPPPSCIPDGFEASADDTKTGFPFRFDRLGVRVPAVLVSPWIERGTVVPAPGEPNGRTFEHASIPATVTKFFLGDYDRRSQREKNAETFMDLISDQMRPDSDCPYFR